MTLTGTIRVFMDEDTIFLAIEWKGEEFRRMVKHDNTKPHDDLGATLSLLAQDIKQMEAK